jgi:hypothetical protein
MRAFLLGLVLGGCLIPDSPDVLQYVPDNMMDYCSSASFPIQECERYYEWVPVQYYGKFPARGRYHLRRGWRYRYH